MRKVFVEFLIIGFILLLNYGMQLYATDLSIKDKEQFIEIDEETREGDIITKKIPAIEDPCNYGKSAYEQVKLYLKNSLNLKYEKSEAQRLLKEIKAKKFNNIADLTTILNLTLPNWSCKNNFKLHKTKNLGLYYFKIENGIGVFIAVMGNGYLPIEGVVKGNASLKLNPGLYGNDNYLQVSITKITKDPNEKEDNSQKIKAQKILNNFLQYAYDYAHKYYTILIQEIDKKSKNK